MAWYNESRRHSLASRGVKTAIDNKPIISRVANINQHITDEEVSRYEKPVYYKGEYWEIVNFEDGEYTLDNGKGKTAYARPEEVEKHYDKPKKKEKENLYSKNLWTEQELKLVLRRINSGKITTEEIFDQNKNLDEGEGVELTPEQNKKGLEWLRKQHYTPTGKEKESSPFGSRDTLIIDDPQAKFYVIDFHSPRGNYHYPLYQVCGGGECMDYYVEAGKINIVG